MPTPPKANPKRPKTGGRKPGTPNKVTTAATLLELCRKAVKKKDWHPVVEMAKVAEDPNMPHELRHQARKEAAAYMAPKLKALEHKVDEGTAAMFNMSFGAASKDTKDTK